MIDEDLPEEEKTDSDDDLQWENEILKLKLQAETGGFFESSGNLSPEMENEFLQHVMAFEQAARNVKTVKVYELLGRPYFRRGDELTPEELTIELQRINELMAQNGMALDVLGQYDEYTIYRFLTEELFEQETEDIRLPGMVVHFTYEEFHPNHKMDLEERAAEFFEGWFCRKMDENSWELADPFIFPDASQMSREAVTARMKAFFDAFPEFENHQYSISEVSFQWEDATNSGLGNVEGTVAYDARMESGEWMHLEGPFKLYLTNTEGWWSIFYFVLPGFPWK